MIVVVVLVLLGAILLLFGYGLARAAGRRPWWEEMHDDLDALPMTREGPGTDDPEAFPPDDHETR